MANYYWKDTKLNVIINNDQDFKSGPGANISLGPGTTLAVTPTALSYTSANYVGLTFNYLNTFHSEESTQPAVSFICNDYMGLTPTDGSKFSNTLCPRKDFFTTASPGTASVGNANFIYFIMKSGGGGGGGGGGGTITNSKWGGGGGGGSGGGCMARRIAVSGGNYTYSVGAGGNGGAGGRLSTTPGPLNSDGDPGVSGGSSSITYGGTTYTINGGSRGLGGKLGTSPGTDGAGGGGGNFPGVPTTPFPAYEVTSTGLNAGDGAPGANTSAGGNAGYPGDFNYRATGSNAYIVSNHISYGIGGNGGGGYRGPNSPSLPWSTPGNPGSDGYIIVFYYYN